MITINGKELRNLEEQVQKNKEDIAKHYQATNLPVNLAGITVLGKITDPIELDGVVGDNYGDAYVQIIDDDTFLWIWTRANPDAGEPDDYWLDIPFTTVGPQGPQGESIVGPKGERGSKWFIYSSAPTTTAGFLEGDMVMVPATGQIYHLHNVDGTLTWLNEGSLEGKQGPVGPQGPASTVPGPKGDTGARGPAGSPAQNIVIRGTAASVDNLPNPSTVDRDTAYLVGGYGTYDLYVITGNAPSLSWVAVGPLESGTSVQVGGSFVPIFDADSKVDVFNGTYQSKWLHTYSLRGEAQQNGAKTTRWKVCMTEAADGTLPTGGNASLWNLADITNSPALRAAGGNIPLPAQTSTTRPHYAARRDWVSNNFGKKLNKNVFTGRFTLGKPLYGYSGYIDPAVGLEEATQIPASGLPNTVNFIFNNSSIIGLAGGKGFYGMVYDEDPSLPNITVSTDQLGNKEFVITRYGYNYDIMGEDMFYITFLNPNNIPQTYFYQFFDMTGSDENSFQYITMMAENNTYFQTYAQISN